MQWMPWNYHESVLRVSNYEDSPTDFQLSAFFVDHQTNPTTRRHRRRLHRLPRILPHWYQNLCQVLKRMQR